MNYDVNSILLFIGLYFSFNLVQQLIILIGNLFDLITALITMKISLIQESLLEKDNGEEETVIGFQPPIDFLNDKDVDDE